MRYAKKERAVVYNQQVWLNDLNYHNTFQRYHPEDCYRHNHILIHILKTFEDKFDILIIEVEVDYLGKPNLCVGLQLIANCLWMLATQFGILIKYQHIYRRRRPPSLRKNTLCVSCREMSVEIFLFLFFFCK